MTDWGAESAKAAAERRAKRRARERKRLRRQRQVALGALAICLLVPGTILLGGSGENANTAAEAPRRSGAEPLSALGLARNSAPQPDWRPHRGPVPILEYHVIGDPPPSAPYPELFVGRSDFRRQLDWLRAEGFEAVTLEQVQDAWYENGKLPPNPVVLAFDDGYRPDYTFALPELHKRGWAGVLNLKAEGSDLYPSNVKAMLDAGWELASHTINHYDLTTLDESQLREEIAGSRQMLSREYGVPVENFCYPAGRFDAAAVAAVEDAGYVGATTQRRGYARREEPFELARFEVLRSSGTDGVAAMLGS